MVRITYMGKEIKQPRHKDGKYAQKSYRSMVFGFAALGIVAGIISLAPKNTVSAVNTEQVITVEVDKTPEKVDALKNKLVDEIAQCESHNAPQDKALIVYDNNSKGTLKGKNVPSIGVMQFKVGTVQHFWKQLYGESLTDYEATMIALNNEQAKKLAKDAIFGIKGALWHWTCATQDMAGRVEILRELGN